MPHTFFPAPGFLLAGTEPLREAFLMVDAAADWCSLEPRCRGFTISAEIHDDRLHWVRFSASGRVVLSRVHAVHDWGTFSLCALTRLRLRCHANAQGNRTRGLCGPEALAPGLK